MRTTPILVLLLIAGVLPAHAQVGPQTALQKSFETAEFFFRPTYLNPYGLDGFGPAVEGLLPDRLLDLDLSPSLVGADSTGRTYAYIDFRNAREKRGQGQYGIYSALEDAARLSLYPGYYEPTYRPAEPVLSAVLIARPAPAALPGLTAGITYRLITDDQGYYDVPTKLYRGLDLAEAAAVGGVPVTDVYSGSDEMRTMGHFPSLFASYQVTADWRLGARLDFAGFDRDGEFGNFYNPPPAGQQDVSISSQFDSRTQRYEHADLSVGVDGRLAGQTHIGGSLGRLSGTAEQVQSGLSRYRYETGDTSLVRFQNGSAYVAGSVMDQELSRDATTSYGTLFLRRRMDSGRTVSLSYRGERRTGTTEGFSSLADSSDSFHRAEYEHNANRYQYASRSFDDREGTGKETGTYHRAAASLEWTLAPSSRLVIGAAASIRRDESDTQESVASASSYLWHNEWSDATRHHVETHSQSLDEVKSLEWSFVSRETALQIPVMLWQRVGEHFELLAGINRRMVDSKVSDETLALYDRRFTEVNGMTELRANFGERYRQPTEFRNEITTSVILGLMARPSEDFEIRLTVSPTRSNLHTDWQTQWWLGFQLRP